MMDGGVSSRVEGSEYFANRGGMMVQAEQKSNTRSRGKAGRIWPRTTRVEKEPRHDANSGLAGAAYRHMPCGLWGSLASLRTMSIFFLWVKG